MNERRKHPRIDLNQIIEISYGREIFLNATGVDISSGGMLLSCSSELLPGQLLEIMVDVQLPGRPLLSLRSDAIVVHSEKSSDRYLVGIKFDGLSEQEEAQLSAICGPKAF